MKTTSITRYTVPWTRLIIIRQVDDDAIVIMNIALESLRQCTLLRLRELGHSEEEVKKKINKAISRKRKKVKLV